MSEESIDDSELNRMMWGLPDAKTSWAKAGEVSELAGFATGIIRAHGLTMPLIQLRRADGTTLKFVITPGMLAGKMRSSQWFVLQMIGQLTTILQNFEDDLVEGKNDADS